MKFTFAHAAPTNLAVEESNIKITPKSEPPPPPLVGVELNLTVGKNGEVEASIVPPQ